MSNFSRFLKQNKIMKENATFPATQSLTDEKGKPLLWTIKPLTTKENDDIRDDCMIEVPVKGKPNAYRPKLNTSKYIAKMGYKEENAISASTIRTGCKCGIVPIGILDCEMDSRDWIDRNRSRKLW